MEKAKQYLHDLDHLNVGQPAPLFALTDIDGVMVDLMDYRGKVVLLDFWASWCGPCRSEYPHLRRIFQKYPRDQFALIGVSFDEDAATVRTFAEKEGFMWPQICEGKWNDAIMAKLYNVMGIPQTYIIDRDGRIAFKGKRGEELETAVDSLISGDSTLA